MIGECLGRLALLHKGVREIYLIRKPERIKRLNVSGDGTREYSSRLADETTPSHQIQSSKKCNLDRFLHWNQIGAEKAGSDFIASSIFEDHMFLMTIKTVTLEINSVKESDS